jgi:hypothetical protein
MDYFFVHAFFFHSCTFLALSLSEVLDEAISLGTVANFAHTHIHTPQGLDEAISLGTAVNYQCSSSRASPSLYMYTYVYMYI